VADVLERVQGFHSMARLTTANFEECLAHFEPLADPDFSRRLLDQPEAANSIAYVERLQHRAANYVLSSVLLLEHVKHHVVTKFPDPAHRTRVQHDRGLDIAVNRYEGHLVVVQLRHLIAHRALPRVRMEPGSHPEEIATPVIDRRQLLEDNKLKTGVRKILQRWPTDDISLSGLIRDDGMYVMQFVDWFAHIVAMHQIDEIVPIERLRRRRAELREHFGLESAPDP
jgi:hypothetical protein